MIKSMTGYGRGRFDWDGCEFVVEIKSVNHKYHDISVKIQKNMNYLEEHVKRRVNEVISRGKVDIFVTYSNFLGENKEIKIDEVLVENYILTLRKIAQKMKINDEISIADIFKFPDIITIVEKQNEEENQARLDIALEEAISNFLEMRENEGKKIAIDLQNRIKRINEYLEKISKLSSGLVEEYVVKLKERVKEILANDVVDENRIAMEAVIYADRSSIEEEITRLNSHISQFGKIINEDKPCGKKADFLIQEMNREINTIASKTTCLEITNCVVEIKNELENMREQIQNIE